MFFRKDSLILFVRNYEMWFTVLPVFGLYLCKRKTVSSCSKLCFLIETSACIFLRSLGWFFSTFWYCLCWSSMLNLDIMIKSFCDFAIIQSGAEASWGNLASFKVWHTHLNLEYCSKDALGNTHITHTHTSETSEGTFLAPSCPFLVSSLCFSDSSAYGCSNF